MNGIECERKEQCGIISPSILPGQQVALQSSSGRVYLNEFSICGIHLEEQLMEENELTRELKTSKKSIVTKCVPSSL